MLDWFRSLKLHDRSRIETLFIRMSYLQQPDDSVYLKHSIIDIVDFDDPAAAAAINHARPDILVDLIGHLDGSRAAIIGMRPAKIQVHFLGQTATLGDKKFISHYIGDRITNPPEYAHGYAVVLILCVLTVKESLVVLPRFFASGFIYVPSFLIVKDTQQCTLISPFCQNTTGPLRVSELCLVGRDGQPWTFRQFRPLLFARYPP